LAGPPLGYLRPVPAGAGAGTATIARTVNNTLKVVVAVVLITIPFEWLSVVNRFGRDVVIAS
jgi:hypothetical protein